MKMVGSIKNITGQRVEVSRGMSESKAQSEKLSGSVPSNISGSKVDAVLTSKSREALKVMAENPSINMEAVERIKQKIKDGEYPIDFDKLADKLLESYWYSKS
jgi:flagellar biosynthesis anti-sigma factor FlgM